MTQTNTPGPQFQWKDVIIPLLGIAAEIVVTKLFPDDFYPAIAIVFILFVLLVFIAIKSVLMRAIGIVVSGVVVAALIMIRIGNTTTTPSFEINFLHAPFGSDGAYYVTDSLIRAQGDLSRYKDFALSPLTVEVVPHYLGDGRYGHVVLRMTGDATPTDYPLWTDFDKAAETQTIQISLADIVRASGIQQNAANEATNLMIGNDRFQQATLKLEIVRLSQPDRPLGQAKALVVKNAPWKQEVSTIWRKGWVLDYALTNFGGEATFHCRMNIGRVMSDVGSSDDRFWSGIQTLKNPPRCAPFSLRTGETYHTSFPLNKDTLGEELMHGRYLVEVYSFAERGDVTFPSGLDYEKADDTWLISNDTHVETFVLCFDPGKTCEQTSTLPVEQETIRAFPFTSGAEWNNGTTYFEVRTYSVGNRSTNQYVLDYWIDPQKTGWVGFGLWFENLVDVSQFNAIRFMLALDASAHPIWLDVKGKVGSEYKVSRVAIGDGTYGAPIAVEQTVVVPLSAYQGIDWTQVDTLNFVIDSYKVPDANKHEIKVSELEFIRQ